MSRITPFAAAAALVLGAWGACSAVSLHEAPNFRTDAETYAPGDTVRLVLRNDTDQTILTHPSLCGAVLERRADTGWSWSEPFGPFVVCTAVAAVLQPDDSLVTERALAGIEAGTYRFRVEVTLQESRDRPVLATSSFEVR